MGIKRASTIVLLSLLILSSFAVLGCGESRVETAGLVGIDLFNNATENLEAANSFRMKGNAHIVSNITVNFTDFFPQEEVDEETDVEIIMEKKPELEGMCYMEIDGVKMYVKQDVAYMNIKDEWYLVPADVLGEDSGLSNPLELLDPESSISLLSDAGQVELVNETNESAFYQVSFEENPLIDAEGQESARQNALDFGFSEEQAELFLKSVNRMFTKGTSAKVAISKTSGLITEMTLETDFYLYPCFKELLAQWNDPKLTQAIKMAELKYSFSFELSDFGKDFGLELPDEAIDFKDLPFDWETGKPTAETLQCSANLHLIDAGVMLYAAANNGNYPATIDQLIPEYLESMPVCPTGGVYSLERYSTEPPYAICSEGHYYY